MPRNLITANISQVAEVTVPTNVSRVLALLSTIARAAENNAEYYAAGSPQSLDQLLVARVMDHAMIELADGTRLNWRTERIQE
jgi:hypothetical protein